MELLPTSRLWPTHKGPDGPDRRPDAGVGTRGPGRGAGRPYACIPGPEEQRGTIVGLRDARMAQRWGTSPRGPQSLEGDRRQMEREFSSVWMDGTVPTTCPVRLYPAAFKNPCPWLPQSCAQSCTDRGNDGHGVGSGLSVEHSRREEGSYTGLCPWRQKKRTLPWWVKPAPLDSRVAPSACVP